MYRNVHGQAYTFSIGHLHTRFRCKHFFQNLDIMRWFLGFYSNLREMKELIAFAIAITSLLLKCLQWNNCLFFSISLQIEFDRYRRLINNFKTYNNIGCYKNIWDDYHCDLFASFSYYSASHLNAKGGTFSKHYVQI